MHLPIATTIAATGLFAASRPGFADRATNDLSLPTSVASLVARQDDTEPPPFVTSITFLTSIAFVTAEPSSSVDTSSRSPDTSSGPPPPEPASSTTAEPVETATSSERPSTTTSTTTSTSPTPTKTKTSTAMYTTSTIASPTATAHPEVDPGPWLSRGKIAGIVVGSVFGLIFLGMTFYALFAASRGINVCNCFGGCCGKRDNDDEEKSRSRLPTRSEDTYPHPDSLQPAGGYRAYRPARPVSHQPQQQDPVPLGYRGR